ISSPLFAGRCVSVVRSCNVAHFGKVDELVSLVTELVPGVLTPKERAQLLLRLRAKVGNVLTLLIT
uniref:TERF1-interacting nuclear factor 2 N-terminal domain-containing protein n=1 Tax=Gouania willdenowi TaxID=441366 RepID=A0A8C5HN48_GOUWI